MSFVEFVAQFAIGSIPVRGACCIQTGICRTADYFAPTRTTVACHRESLCRALHVCAVEQRAARFALCESKTNVRRRRLFGWRLPLCVPLRKVTQGITDWGGLYSECSSSSVMPLSLRKPHGRSTLWRQVAESMCTISRCSHISLRY